MITKILFALAVGAFVSISISAQVILPERKRAKLEGVIRAGEARDRGQQPAAESESGLPRPKPAVMNVNVRGVLTKAEYKNFAEASLHPAAAVTDGEPLWLYLKFNTRLGDYVLADRPTETPDTIRYRLWIEIGPQGDAMTLNQYVLDFTKEDLALNEMKIGLAPGLRGRNASAPVFLANAAARQPGAWKNEIRVTNNIGFPRAKEDNLAKVNLTLDISKGRGKYTEMDAGYDSMTIRGSLDTAVIPFPGTFYNDRIRGEIEKAAAFEGITPARIYFASDGWAESATFTPGAVRTRKIYGVFTYEREGKCYYGTAQVLETFDQMANAFPAEPSITLQKDLPLSCEKLN